MSSQRIVFLDVDGTITDPVGHIAGSTIEAVRTARSRGHRVFLSTGRARSQIAETVRGIGFDGVVCTGGAFVEVDGTLLIQRTMPSGLGERLRDYFHAVRLPHVLQTADGAFADPEAVRRVASGISAGRAASAVGQVSEHRATEPSIRTLDDAPADVWGRAAKALFIGEDPDAYARVVADIGADFHIVTGTIPYLGTSSGEVSGPGVNKGTTIQMLLPMLGFVREQSIAIGDSPNDIEMLEAAGVGIAMGGAEASVVAAADEETTGVLDDGIWNAFERHGLV